MNLFQFDGVIFDLDGTLIDSMDVWAKIDVAFLSRRGLTVPDDYVEAITALSFPQAARYTIDRFGLTESPEAIMAEWQGMAQDAYAHDVPLKPGARALLDALRDRGIPIAAATSSEEALFLPCLRRCGILEHFSVFATTREAGKPKDAPDVYLLAAQRLGLSPARCAVLEDILKGIRGAQAGGFTAIGVYEPYSAYEWPAICQTADHTVRSLTELLPETEHHA